MKKLLILLLFLLWPGLAFGVDYDGTSYGEVFFVCEGGDGSAPLQGDDGIPDNCATCWDLSDADTSGNWTASESDSDTLVGPNDCIVLLDDGGNHTNDIAFYQNGTSGKPITIRGAIGDTAVIVGSGGTYGVYLARNYIILQDVTVRNSGTYVLDTGANSSRSNQIVDNVIIDSGVIAFNIYKLASSSLTNITISGMTNATQAARFVKGTTDGILENTTISGLTISGSTGAGMVLYGMQLDSGSSFTQNTFHTNGTSGLVFDDSGGTACSNCAVSYITSYDNALHGIWSNDGSDCSISNSIIYSNDADGVYAYDASTYTLTTSVIYDNGSAAVGYGDGATGHDGDTATISDCDFYGNWETGVGLGGTDPGPTVTITNCRFWDNGNGAGKTRNANIWAAQNNVGTLNVSGCILSGATYDMSLDLDMAITSNNNIFISNSFEWFAVGAGTQTTGNLTDWQSASGQDAGSTITNENSVGPFMGMGM